MIWVPQKRGFKCVESITGATSSMQACPTCAPWQNCWEALLRQSLFCGSQAVACNPRLMRDHSFDFIWLVQIRENCRLFCGCSPPGTTGPCLAHLSMWVEMQSGTSTCCASLAQKRITTASTSPAARARQWQGTVGMRFRMGKLCLRWKVLSQNCLSGEYYSVNPVAINNSSVDVLTENCRSATWLHVSCFSDRETLQPQNCNGARGGRK